MINQLIGLFAVRYYHGTSNISEIMKQNEMKRKCNRFCYRVALVLSPYLVALNRTKFDVIAIIHV